MTISRVRHQKLWVIDDDFAGTIIFDTECSFLHFTFLSPLGDWDASRLGFIFACSDSPDKLKALDCFKAN